jgi:hypothetical protein
LEFKISPSIANLFYSSYTLKAMSNSIYNINKGINKSIEFHGLKAQYIWYLAAGVIILMILFALLYILGVSTYFCLLFIAISVGLLVYKVYAWSAKYGEHGMMKALAARKTPKVLKSYGRSLFFNHRTQSSLTQHNEK